MKNSTLICILNGVLIGMSVVNSPFPFWTKILVWILLGLSFFEYGHFLKNKKMNTHIIIPIKDIETEINILSSDPIFKEIKKDIKQHNGISPQQKNKRNLLLQKIEGLQWVLYNGKQIFLTEESIEKLDEPKEVGILTKPLGLNGYKTAKIGHKVFETKDRYIIYLEHEKLPTLAVPFYKESLSYYITRQF